MFWKRKQKQKRYTVIILTDKPIQVSKDEFDDAMEVALSAHEEGFEVFVFDNKTEKEMWNYRRDDGEN
jgi:predicted mannosyl-3-phosphoglycerate phosphatase (HAD superfamily)